MKFLDLFSGIGGFRIGLERNGHECVGFCEIDKYARKSYKTIHDTEKEVEMHDITKISDEFIRGLGTVDIICGGFPCQAFSIAGRRQGFEDTRGTLFFEIARFASILRPRYLFLENVKGLLNHERGATFETILRTLDELGYDAEWQVLNSKNFGVPQNRERVFIIGHLRGERTRKVFPIQGSNGKVNENRIKVIGNTSRTNHDAQNVLGADGISTTLMARDYKGAKQIMVREATKKGYAIAEEGDSINFAYPNSKSRRGRVGKKIAQTLTTSVNQGTLVLPAIGASNALTTVTKNNLLMDGEYKIRKLTPLEYWRLQGFTDEAFEKAAEVNSNSQLYKQAGNSVTVNVIQAIAERL